MTAPYPAANPAADAPAKPASPRAAVDRAPPIPSAALLHGQKTVLIEHHGTLYCLRLTRQGKLILTK